MQLTTEPVLVSKGSRWAGRIISGLMAVFLVFDAVAKVMKARPVMEASVRIGFPEGTIIGIGAALLVCTVLYVISQTAVLGAILLTGYLGGATAANVRAGTGAFNTCFPVVFGVLVWVGLWLRESRLQALIPWRS